MKIVFLGDNITEDCFELNPSGDSYDVIYDRKNCYVSYTEELLCREFPNEDITVINAGISGNSAEEGLERLSRDALAHRPELVVVCFGLNNGCKRDPDGFFNTMDSIFRRLTEQGCSVVYMTPSMYNTYVHAEVIDRLLDMAADCADCQNSGAMDRVIAAGISAARKNGVTVCDAYEKWKTMQRYGIDTTALLSNKLNHPTRKKHRLFADMLFPMFLELIRARLSD